MLVGYFISCIKGKLKVGKNWKSNPLSQVFNCNEDMLLF